MIAMPMLAPITMVWPSIANGALSMAMMRSAMPSSTAWSADTEVMTANSSPPSRATRSSLRSVPDSRRVTLRINSSPTGWPSVSLTSLK